MGKTRGEHTSVLRDVSHPRERLVPALLDNLEIPDLDTTGCKVRDLVLDANRRPLVGILVADTGESKMAAHHVFLAACELLDFPNKGTLLWLV